MSILPLPIQFPQENDIQFLTKNLSNVYVPKVQLRIFFGVVAFICACEPV